MYIVIKILLFKKISIKGLFWCVLYKINIISKVSFCLMDYLIYGYLLDYGFIKELFLGGIF